MLKNIRNILIIIAALITVVLVLIIIAIKSFEPTETPAFGFSKPISVSSISANTSNSSSDSSSAETHSTEGSSQTTSVVSSVNSAESSESTVEVPPAENHPRLRELQLRLTYGEHWKLLLSDNQKALADSSLFVGDSICSGFSSYGLTTWKNSYAAGSVGTRNFFESEIKYFGEVKSYKDVLTEKQPQRIFLWMGMNDVNVITSVEYARNYKEIIDYSLENSDAEVCVLAMTPVNSDFTPNKRIESFNEALQNMISENYTEHVRFIDFAYVVTDSNGELCANYDAGDGVHLAPDVYYLAMIEICDQLGIPS